MHYQIVNIPGPYKKIWREEWLRRVLLAQVEARENAPDDMKDIELINIEELSEIRRIWIEEFHEFDDSLPRIYQEVTKQNFVDPRPNAGNSELGADEWQILEELCDNSMQLELMVRLLDTERQFQTMSRRVGVIDALERCFDTSSRSQEEAIETAKTSREIKKAAQDGDIEVVKSFIADDSNVGKDTKTNLPVKNWSSIKFPS
jgi:DNA sulfur modification protein DndC